MSADSPPASPDSSSSDMAPFSPSQNPSPFPSPQPSPHSRTSSSSSASSSSANHEAEPLPSILSATSSSDIPLASFAILPPTHAPPPPVPPPATPPPLTVSLGETSTPPPLLSFSTEVDISPPALQLALSEDMPSRRISQPVPFSQQDITSEAASQPFFSQPDLVLDISPARFATTPSVPTRPPPQPVHTSNAPDEKTVPAPNPGDTSSSAPLSLSTQQSSDNELGRESTSPVVHLADFLADSSPPQPLPTTTPTPFQGPPSTEVLIPTSPPLDQSSSSRSSSPEQSHERPIPVRRLSSPAAVTRALSVPHKRRLSLSSTHSLPHEPALLDGTLPRITIPTGKQFNELAVWKIYCGFRCVVQRRVLHALWVWKVMAAAHVRNQRLLRDSSPIGNRRPRSGTTGSLSRNGRSPLDEETKRSMGRMSTHRRIELDSDTTTSFHFQSELPEGEREGTEEAATTAEEELPVVQSNRRPPPKEKTPLPTRLADYYTVFGMDPSVMKAAEAELATKSKAELAATIDDINSRLSKELTPVVLSRWPLTNYSKDYPLDPEWAGFGFPDGLSLYTNHRPVSMFYAISTRSVGSHLCHVYLSCSKPLQVGEGKAVYAPVVFMLVSHYPQFEVLSRCLSEIYSLTVSKTRSTQAIPVERHLVHLLHEIPVPLRGECCEFHVGSLTLRALSSPRFMCSVFEISPLFTMLNADNILVILAAILCECRILVTSSSRMSLTIACESLLQLLYPFQWHFSYVPVLSNNMLAAVSNFQPFLLGIHRSHLGEVDLEEVILVDLDHNTVRCDTPQSVPKLPIKPGTALRRSLRESISAFVSAKDHVNLRDSEEFTKNVYKSMLRFFSEILGGYRQFLFFIHDDPRFNSHGFRQTRDTADDIFYERFVNSLAFNKYMERDYDPDPYHHCLAQPDLRGGFQIDSLITLEFTEPLTERIAPINLKSPSHKPESKESDHTVGGDLYEQIKIRPEFATVSTAPMKLRVPPYEEKRPKFTTFEPGSSEERLKMFMEGVYDCVNLRPSEIAAVKPLLSKPVVREALAEILTQPSLRSPSAAPPCSQPGTPLLCLTENSFTILADVLTETLNECQKANDFATATAILECGYEFFMEEKPGGNKIRMETPLHRHPLWKNPSFWLESLNCTLEARKRLRAIHGNRPPDALSPKVEQATKLHVEWMIGAVDRMLEFGIAEAQVKTVMRTLSSRHGLSPQQDEMLTNFMGTRLS